MDELHTRLRAVEAKLDAVHTSVERMRKYFQVLLWVTVGMVVVPIIGLLIVVPMVLNMYASMMSGLL